MVTLATRYSNFRRVIIEMEEYKPTDVSRDKLYTLKIYFHLTCPMNVKLYKFFKDRTYQLKGLNDALLGDRHPNWENTKRKSQQSLEVNESPTFMISLRAMEVCCFIIK